MATKKTNPDTQTIEEKARQSAKTLDGDMPEPATESYEPKLALNGRFMQLFNQAVGQMPYATILTNKADEKMELINLVRFVEAKHNSISIPELNTVISYIATAPFQYVRPLMEMIDDKARQALLWTPVK